MQLFYAPDFTADTYTLPQEESAHCIKVLRAVKGDTLHFTDGRGGLITARVEIADRNGTVVSAVERSADPSPLTYDLTVACAPTKNMDRFEWFVEKAVEVGCAKVVPLCCERSERRTVKEERLQRVAVSAMKQSLKCRLTEISPIVSFDDFIGRDYGDAQLFIAHCAPDEHKRLLRDLVEPKRRVVVMIGPEGDFSHREVERAEAAGFKPVSLGESRLRTETAALAGVMTVALVNQ